MASNHTLVVDHSDYLKDEEMSQELNEEMSQELRDILSSLSSQSLWFHRTIYLYQGFWYLATVIKRVVAFQKHFTAQDSDVLIATPPKSGTTWTKALVFALMNRDKYEINGKHPLLETSPHDLVPSFEFDLYADKKSINLSDLESPRLLATHIPYASLPRCVKESNCKIIYVGRNLKDILISQWHFENKLKDESKEAISLEEAFDAFCKGETVFGPVWEHLLEYWKESLKKPEKIMFLKYEEMKEDAGKQARKVAEFLGRPFSDEEEDRGVVGWVVKLASFENLSKLEVNQGGKLANGFPKSVFFRKGGVGDWRNYLTKEMEEQINLITQQRLSGFGLNL